MPEDLKPLCCLFLGFFASSFVECTHSYVMKISLLVSNLSANCAGRAYILAKVLARHCDVEVIGPAFSSGIWSPCDTGELVYKAVPARSYPHFFVAAARIVALIEGQVIYALKPLATSYGLALLTRSRHRLPIVLDIDDWEVGFARWNFAHSRKLWGQVRDPNWILWILLLEKCTGLADKITVSGQFLAKRYSGYLVPHGRDVSFLDPSQYDAIALKAASGFDDKKVILFLGTPKSYKGVEDLIAAVHMVSRDDLRLLLVGADVRDPYVRALIMQAGDILQVVGMCPLSKRPQWLAVADMVVLPQRASSATVGQVPAKLFDAMAMAKPIVATAVSDVPAILDGCGLVVPPGDVEALADRIRYVLDNPREATQLGMAARHKCVRDYSWEAMERVLLQVFSEYDQ